MDFLLRRCRVCDDPVALHFIPTPEPVVKGNVLVFPPRCPGKGKHEKPVLKTRTKKFFFVEEFEIYFPRTSWNKISGYRYLGPPKLYCFIYAMLFGVRKRNGEKYRKMYLGKKLIIWTPQLPHFWKKIYTLLKTGEGMRS